MVLELIAVGISGVTGVAGFVFGVLGYRAAKQSNSLAEEANRVSVDAQVTAKEANELAQDANDIAERAFAAGSDHTTYNWGFEIDDDGTAVVFNNCAFDAYDFAAVFTCREATELSIKHEQVPAFDKVVGSLDGVIEQHFNEVRNNPSRHASNAGGIFMTGSAGNIVSTTVSAHLSWVTPSGVKRACILDYVLRHRDNYGSIERK